MKKIFALILTLIFLCGCSIGSSEENGRTLHSLLPGAKQIGTSTYSCITGESGESEQISKTGTVKAKAFAHGIYNSSNEYMVTLTSTLVCTYSPDNNTSSMTKISAALSDVQIEGLTVSEHLSGDTATVILYLNQISICHFQYRISPDGTLEFLSEN